MDGDKLAAKKNSGSSYTNMIVIIIFCVLLLGGIGFVKYFYGKSSNSPPPSECVALTKCKISLETDCTKCDICEYGYSVDSTGQCNKCAVVANCATLAVDGCTCSACKPGYKGAGTSSCASCSIPNCSAASSECNSCITCDDAHALDANGQCQPSCSRGEVLTSTTPCLCGDEKSLCTKSTVSNTNTWCVSSSLDQKTKPKQCVDIGPKPPYKPFKLRFPP